MNFNRRREQYESNIKAYGKVVRGTLASEGRKINDRLRQIYRGKKLFGFKSKQLPQSGTGLQRKPNKHL